ncbi:DUF2062 domain-containing protein [Pseudooceanicola algae]
MISDFVWPRGGWARAFHYTKHRLRRLPDSPEKISRGIAVGIFTVFTPLFGLHFPFAAALALLVRGNVLAALLATFISNPLTFVPISLISLQTGFYIVNTAAEHGIGNGVQFGFHPPGAHMPPPPPPPGFAGGPDVLGPNGDPGLPGMGMGPGDGRRSFVGKFVDAGEDLADNIRALFTDAEPHWEGLRIFYHEIFFPYLIGGIVPGVIFGIIGYYVTVPVIRAYQTRRRGVLKAKLAAIRAKSGQAPKPRSKPVSETGKGR